MKTIVLLFVLLSVVISTQAKSTGVWHPARFTGAGSTDGTTDSTTVTTTALSTGVFHPAWSTGSTGSTDGTTDSTTVTTTGPQLLSGKNGSATPTSCLTLTILLGMTSFFYTSFPTYL